ncbi:protein transport protein Sec24C isoform X1 [Culex quinquefasciatus]|nr:protein transport protein Sec24C isoform X1 [Culex quinquefasciatus]XP_038109773.1 protein transport protein Sec24C isoform X1 [Culex quinquefasciatus]XP_038109774.1 protein transport protein Sec24C isoform X1 [Culex quinquefasciatus]
MNPPMSAYGQPPQGWPQQGVGQAAAAAPPPLPPVNGAPQNLPNQFQNMSLGGPPLKHEQAPFPNQPMVGRPPSGAPPVAPGGGIPGGFPHQQQQPGQPPLQNGPPPVGQPPGMAARPPVAPNYGLPNGHQQSMQPNQPGMPPNPMVPGQPPMQYAPTQPMGGPPRPGQPMPAMGQQPNYPPQPYQQQQPPQQFAPPPLQAQPQFPPQQQQQQPYPGQPGMPPMPAAPGQYAPGGPGMQQPPMSGPGMPPNAAPGGYPMQPGQMPPQMQQGGGAPPHMLPPHSRGYNQQPGPQGYGQMPGQQGPHYPPAPAPPAQNRLDPDSMPNPIQVMSENQRSCGGEFATNAAGLVPPLATTKFITQDQGNSGPRYMRSSMYNVPVNTDMMKQSAVPFALIVSPFARAAEKELAPPIVNFGELGPIRCIRCKAYMCPFMQFIDGGRRFQCLLCKATTEVPAEYFQHLDHTGQRMDKYERPELVLGTYEFVATKDYCRNNTPPKPPAMVFVIDVSYNNVKSGLVHLLCAEIKNIIRHLPVDEGQERTSMKVGFITYNSSVHFYNCKSSLAQPQMMVVGDVQEMFMPLLDGFLVDPEESSVVIDALMQQIPKMFGDTRETETILLPALQAGLEALKASDCAGKLYVFHSSLPTAEAPGKLKARDDRKLLGTDKEKTVLTPQSTVYNMLGQECVGAGVSVDLFIMNNSYIDLATIGQVSRLTGGEIYKYTYFQADIDGQRLVNDLIKNISRPIAFDTVMRVRTSTGIRPTDFFGHFFMSNTTDMEIASVDCDKSLAIEIKHDDKLTDENVFIQVALLFTSCSGQRRLRVLNLSLKTCNQLADLFRSCDLDTTILFFAKQGLFKLLENNPKAIKDSLITRAAQILACYRKNCASPTSAGQLILPECMKLLPLYISCLLKNDAFSGGSDLTLDDRSYVIYFVQSMDLLTSVRYFYPRLMAVHDVNVEDSNVPAAIRCTADKMMEDGAYILENGIHMFMWLGLGLSPEFTQSVFGAQCTQQIDTDRTGLPVFDNPLSKRVRGIVDSIQNEKHRCMRLTLVKQRDKLESVLRHFLVEDRGMSDGSASYVDFLCHMHKEIRTLLS